VEESALSTSSESARAISTSATAMYLPSGLNLIPLVACFGPEMYTKDFDANDHMVILQAQLNVRDGVDVSFETSAWQHAPDLKVCCDKDVQTIWTPLHSLSSSKALINLACPIRLNN